jgi:hypothetical protein
LLQERGLQVIAQETDNYSLPAYPDLIVKDSYCRRPECNLASNDIDFCVQVLGLLLWKSPSKFAIIEYGVRSNEDRRLRFGCGGKAIP